METKHLDGLMAHVAIKDRHTHDCKQTKQLDDLFISHGPALVTALTACVRPGHHIDCGMADPDNPICDCGNEEARAVLLKLDQEAKG